jgi:hypothetical protein
VIQTKKPRKTTTLIETKEAMPRIREKTLIIKPLILIKTFIMRLVRNDGFSEVSSLPNRLHGEKRVFNKISIEKKL